MSLPVVEPLDPAPSVEHALRALGAWPSVLLFDSAERRGTLGEFSFLTADPYHFFDLPRASLGMDPFEPVRRMLREHAAERLPGLPPFQGGAAGVLAYELGGCWERTLTASMDEFRTPVLAVGLFDWVLAWDHRIGQAWIISQGIPYVARHKRRERATARIRSVRSALAGNASAFPQRPNPMHRNASQFADVTPAASHSAPGLDGLLSDFSRDGFLKSVERVIEYIHAGDIFQANLSQRLLFPAHRLDQIATPVELYLRLRRENPAPFAGYFSHEDWAILSASPERFVSVNDRTVTTRPIKGTRQRRAVPEADLYSRDELRESEKDQAENVMIVDLLRNDLSRVCQAGSVTVPELCTVEAYQTVQHLVSEVRGTLQDGKTCWDLLSCVFPGGS
ncbi:MAG: anthranilate synthase component I family protein, partial [Planctomycetota bacterium]|nr:anthranilate synthase component I family protein [Planctomycetota bacterium]